MTLLIEEQLASIMPYLVKVAWYDEKQGIWLLYSPDAPSNLTALAKGEVYIIDVTAPVTIDYKGVSTPLHEGWNEVVWEVPERKAVWPWVVGIGALLTAIIILKKK